MGMGSPWTIVLAVAVTACSFHPQGVGDDARGGDATGVDAPPDGLPDDCAPAATACEGRTLRTCGADHHWDATQDRACDFTCSAGACVTASNVPLAQVATCTSAAPRLAPPAGATVTVTSAGGLHLACSPDCGDTGVTRIDPQATLTAPTPDLAWFCLSSITIPSDVTLTVPATGGPAEAIAFVVDGVVVIDGTIDLDGFDATSGAAGGEGAPGGSDGAQRSGSNGVTGSGLCGGSGGAQMGAGGDSMNWAGGGGGGAGNATVAAAGGSGRSGNGNQTAIGGAAGGVCSTEIVIPLVGGSGGGGGGDATVGNTTGWAGGGGGGALQISSRVSITIAGTITARGGAGYGLATGTDGGGGGGAGGAILLESRAIGGAGKLVVDGGSGGPGGAGPGGAGATGSTPAQPGASFAASGQGGSGGGGAAGRIRINEAGAACLASTSPIASCTAAELVAQ